MRDLQSHRNQLHEVRSLFQKFELAEAYRILRRFFDRLPFSPEPDHAEFISLFVQVLLELGKEKELSFYTRELEKLNQTDPNPHFSFALGVVYTYGPTPKLEAVRKLFEAVLKDPSAEALHFRSSLFLAHYYEWVRDDVATCRKIIDGLATPEDQEMKYKLELWKAMILLFEERFSESEAYYTRLFKSLTPATSWYCYYTGRLGFALMYLRSGRREKAWELANEVAAELAGKPCKQLMVKLDTLRTQLSREQTVDIVFSEQRIEGALVIFEKRQLRLARGTASERLWSLFSRERCVDKRTIAEKLFGDRPRPNRSQSVRYQVHRLRKFLEQLGLSSPIKFEGGKYHLVPQVQFSRENSENINH